MIWLFTAWADPPDHNILGLKVGEAPVHNTLDLKIGDDFIATRSERGCVFAPLRQDAQALKGRGWVGQVRGGERRQPGLWLTWITERDEKFSYLIQKIPISKYRGRIYFEALEPLRPFFDCDYLEAPAETLVENLESLAGRQARGVLMELIAAGLVRNDRGFSCGWAVGEYARECWSGSCSRWVDRVKQIDEHGCPEIPFPHGEKFLEGWPGQRDFVWP